MWGFSLAETYKRMAFNGRCSGVDVDEKTSAHDPKVSTDGTLVGPSRP